MAKRKRDCDVGQHNMKQSCTCDFHFEILGNLANFFIAKNTFLSWDPHSPSTKEERLIGKFIASMKCELENIYTHLPTEGRANEYYNEKFREHRDKILQNTDNLQLFQLIRDSLEKEANVLRKIRQTQLSSAESPKTYENLKEEINDSLNNCKEACDAVNDRVVEMSGKWTALRSQPHYQQMTQIKAKKDTLDNEVSTCIHNLSEVHKEILKVLEDFKEKQRLVTFVFREKLEENKTEGLATQLDDIQSWLEKFAECLAVMHTFLQEYNPLFHSDTVSTKSADWLKQLEKFEAKTKAVACVIECQPYQAIRTNNNNELKVRVLPWKNGHMEISNVNTVLINKKTAIKVVQKSSGTVKSISVANPVETTKHLNLPASTGEIVAKHHSTDNKLLSVINLKISKITRCQKQPGKSVLEEKHWLYFRVDVDLTGDHWTERFFFNKLSLPISVLSHTTSQEEICIPHLIWFNAFPSSMRTCDGLDVPTTLKWTYLLDYIDLEFSKLGRSLTHEQSEFLKAKLFRGIARPDDMVNFEEFYGKTIEASDFAPVPGPSNSSPKHQKFFSFFEWLFECLTVLNCDTHPNTETLKELWGDGRIIGFMEKEKMEQVVESRGTCLIFFPESLKGTISVHYYNSKAGRLTKDTYTLSELAKKPLEERILEKKDISYLYSNFTGIGRKVKKEEAFKIKPKTNNVIINEEGYIINPPTITLEDQSITYLNSTDVKK